MKYKEKKKKEMAEQRLIDANMLIKILKEYLPGDYYKYACYAIYATPTIEEYKKGCGKNIKQI